jgi:hypothetical protein
MSWWFFIPEMALDMERIMGGSFVLVKERDRWVVGDEG